MSDIQHPSALAVSEETPEVPRWQRVAGVLAVAVAAAAGLTGLILTAWGFVEGGGWVLCISTGLIALVSSLIETAEGIEEVGRAAKRTSISVFSWRHLRGERLFFCCRACWDTSRC